MYLVRPADTYAKKATLCRQPVGRARIWRPSSRALMIGQVLFLRKFVFEFPAVSRRGLWELTTHLDYGSKPGLGAPCPLFKCRRLRRECGALERNSREMFAPTYSSML